MAISCSLSRNLLRTDSCGYSLPVVKDIYLANYADVTTTVTGDTSETGCTGEVINITSTGATFYHIEPSKDSVTFTDELVVEDSGNKYRTHTLTFNLSNKYDSCLHMDFDALSLGRYFAVVVTADGTWLGLGRLTGLEASAATLSGGSDQNGVSITLSANVAESAMPLSEASIAIVRGN
jgi:hypothetical protein